MTKPKFHYTFLQGLIFGACAFLACLLIVSATSRPSTYDVRKSTAEVEQLAGFYVFVDSKPVTEYEYLGTINGTGGRGSFNPQYTVVRDALLKLARKKYPDADGIMLHLNAGGKDRADVVKFKDPAK